MTTLALAERQSDILAALRRLGGEATVGDVVASTGLPSTESEAALKSLLESHQGHLAVSDSGELLYRFDEKLIERGSEPLLARVKRRAWSLFSKAFKAWIVVMLVVYFVVFVILVLAALFGSNAQGGGDRRRGGGWGGRGGRRGGGLPLGNFWLWYWIWSPRWYLGRPYYGHRWERTLAKDDRVPFYKKVFAFVFGPDRPHPTRQQLDRSTLRLIRARSGVITTADLVQHTGLSVPEAESEMGRLVGAYDGEPVVSAEGELAYAFPSLMTSAHGTVSAREPNPAWMRLEYPEALTGNSAGANALVGGMNAFTLVAAATAPWFIFPRLGLGGPAAWVGLVLVPVIFSLAFFAVPALRMWGVKRENKRRKKRNLRRVVLGLVYTRSLEGGGVTAEEATEYASSRLKHQAVGRKAVESVLEGLVAEFDGQVDASPHGLLVYRFPEIRTQMAAGEAVRRSLALQDRELGEIVYDSGDTPSQADAREQAAFDRDLASGPPSPPAALPPEELDLSRYIPPSDVGYEADYELVLADEEVKRRQKEPAWSMLR